MRTRPTPLQLHHLPQRLYIHALHPVTPRKVTGGPEQQATARALNTVCGSRGCSFIVNTGDNFYECGVDNMTRFKVGGLLWAM